MKNFCRNLCILLALAGAGPATSQVNDLNSNPSASAVVLLDFDGHNVSGTMWNGGGAFNCGSSGINDAAITEVFRRVAEDFRQFNINITTNESIYNSAPANRRMRVVITTSNGWYGNAAGGVAYIGSFSSGDNTPCFVFSALLYFSTKNIAEACSHELGHTFGLRHQSLYNASCVKISDYNPGQGVGEIGWAPIMGVSYNQNMTLWHKGPNSLGCSSMQSDLDIITNAANGFGYRPDDHTDDCATATTATFNNTGQFTISGVIETPDDKDLFKITMPTFGRLQLLATPYSVGSNNSGSDLDLEVEFMDGSYTVAGSYNPGNLLSSVIDTFLNAGTYYLRIDGKGNMYAPEYGSLGSYSLQAIYTNSEVLPLRRFELSGRPDGDLHTLNWVIDADEQVLTQVIEVSSNGIDFIALNEPNNTLRTYSYRPTDNRPLLYRMHIKLDNFKEYYSNIIAIRQAKSARPQLVGNTIGASYVPINSPGNYYYQVIDRSGRMISKGIVEKGYSRINAGSITPGIYIIRFTDGTEQWTEKFIKR